MEEPTSQYSIVADGLTKRFEKVTAVDQVSLRVREGEFLGFLGPNGAGKSTTIKMLCGLLRPTGGQIAVAGHDLLREPLEVKRKIGVPVLTDVHTVDEIAPVAAVVDVLQTPAFLCRQTDFIEAVATCGKPVNIKKGQFLAPGDMKNVADKAREANGGADTIMVCERGASFGYNNLVSDMRSLAIMRDTGCPVVFDATHSVQQPGGQGTSSGGQREFVPVLARAAVAVGVSGLFAETHPDPAKALSDGPNAWPLHLMKELLFTLKDIDALVKQKGFIEARL